MGELVPQHHEIGFLECLHHPSPVGGGGGCGGGGGVLCCLSVVRVCTHVRVASEATIQWRAAPDHSNPLGESPRTQGQRVSIVADDSGAGQREVLPKRAVCRRCSFRSVAGDPAFLSKQSYVTDPSVLEAASTSWTDELDGAYTRVVPS